MGKAQLKEKRNKMRETYVGGEIGIRGPGATRTPGTTVTADIVFTVLDVMISAIVLAYQHTHVWEVIIDHAERSRPSVNPLLPLKILTKRYP